MTETVSLPRWVVISTLPSILALLLGVGGLLWSISNQLTRQDERQSVMDYKFHQIEIQGKLNDEHLRQTQIEQATLNGWQRGKAGEAKPAISRPEDPPTQ